MGKRRRLRKSGGGELEVNMQDVTSDEAILPSVAMADVMILLPYVVGGDEGIIESHVAASDAIIIQQNVASDEANSEQDVASDEEMGEQNAALSQLKYKDRISIDCFRMCGHQIKYRLKKLYKFF